MTYAEFVEWLAYMRIEAEDARNPGRKRGMTWQEQQAAMMAHYNLTKGRHGKR